MFRHVIGLTGPIASGKGLAVKAVRELLADKEVHSILLSDYIREAVREAGNPLNRDTLREAGNARRKAEGPGAWVHEMLRRLRGTAGDVLIVDSIRNPGEIEALRQAFSGQVCIIATDAPFADRIARVLKRGRQDDSTDAEEIARAMTIEMERNPEHGFDLEGCQQMADFVSVGRETKAERISEIQDLVRRFLRTESPELFRAEGYRKVA